MPTKSFEYLEVDNYYFDSACQSLRPKDVIEAELGYYTSSNACGGRGNHPWVQIVDKKITETRQQILDFVGKSALNYTVVFCPNTTYGINLIMQNLDHELYSNIITTNKEHNSVLLPAMSWAKSQQKPLHVLNRSIEHGLDLAEIGKYSGSILIFNTTSNLDGASTGNLPTITNFAKKHDCTVFLDATQSLAHHHLDFSESDFDCLFASGHKLYAPSIGFMVIKKEFIHKLKQTWVGGGTIQSVSSKGYQLINLSEELHARLEFGLQDYAAIFGLNQAINWLKNYKIKEEYPSIDYQSGPISSFGQKFLKSGTNFEAIYYLESLSDLLFNNLQSLEKNGAIKMLNSSPSPIISFAARNISSYELTKKLSEFNIMCRSGYMCCHYYIKDVLGAGPLTRISLGLHNTPKDIARLLIALEQIF